MSDQNKSLKDDLLQGLELLSLKKVGHTAFTFIVNPREVIESNLKGEKRFTSPIKYLLIICTPLAVILNILDLDVENFILLNYSSERHQEAPFFAAIESFKLSEFGPAAYLVLYPILALILKIVFIKTSKSYYYFLSISYYSAGIICFLDITILIGFYFVNNYFPGYTALLALLSGLFLTYFIGRSINLRWFKWLQSIVAVVLFHSILILSLIFLILQYTGNNAPGFDINVGIRKFTYLNEHDLLEKYGINPSSLQVGNGIVIAQINALSPIDKAGVKPGDVLLEINGVNIKEGPEIWAAIDSLSLKLDSIRLTVNHAGSDISLYLPVENYDSSYNRPRKSTLGIRWKQVPTNTYSRTGGALIDSVSANSAAQVAGLQVGDVITKLDNDLMTSYWSSRNAFYRMVSLKNPGDTVKLVITRNQEILNISSITQAPTGTN